MCILPLLIRCVASLPGWLAANGAANQLDSAAQPQRQQFAPVQAHLLRYRVIRSIHSCRSRGSAPRMLVHRDTWQRNVLSHREVGRQEGSSH